MAFVGEKTVSGYLVDDPKEVTTRTNKQMVVARLAENRRVLDRETQQWKDGPTTFYDVAVEMRREQLAQNTLASLRKGAHVVVSGGHHVEPVIVNEEPRLNHHIWAKDIAVSLAHTQVQLPAREAEHGPGLDAQDVALQQGQDWGWNPGQDWGGPER